MRECLDENVAVAFLEGRLTDHREAAIETHVDGCGECLGLLAALARDADPRPAGSRVPDSSPTVGLRAERTHPAPGTTLGRYILQNLVGVGAMGAVYAAYDPELDRRVALKLVRRDPRARGSRAGTDRLLQEARAMAHLTHPNVVSIFDVGTFDSGLFLAMEFIEGTTLSAWLVSRPRSWKEIVSAFVDAGRGLAAAHARGLVHRDFKPDNVLVGSDGRIAVSDFGLAFSVRISEQSDDVAVGHATDPGTRESTAGLVLGTPAYMSPEQLRAEPADARSDQFAFSVALYEALYAWRPYRGETLAELRENIADGQMAEMPRRTKTPSRIGRTLLRGLRARREDRYPSMGDLLNDLTRAPRVTWRRAGLAVGAVGLLGLAGVALQRPEIERRQACRRAEEGFVTSWGGTQKDAIRAAFMATNKPYAEDAWQRIDGALDHYAGEWRAMHGEVCRGNATPRALVPLRTACLDERALELRALTHIFAAADGSTARNAASAVRSLTRIERCADLKWLMVGESARAKSAGDPAARGAREALVEAKVLGDSGKYAEGALVAERVAITSRGQGDRAIEAAALYRWADLSMSAGDARGARDRLVLAERTADAAGDDRTRAQALAELIFVDGYLLRDLPGASASDARLSALLERMGGDDDVEAHRLQALGLAHFEAGKLDLAQPLLTKAAELIAARVYGAESQELAMTLNSLGLVAEGRKDLDAAEALFQRALAIWQRELGAAHPDLALPLNNLGMIAQRRARYDEALAYYRRALTLSENALGPVHRSVAVILGNLGEVHEARGEVALAIPLELRALGITEQLLGPTHTRTASALTTLAVSYVAVGDWPRANEMLGRAGAIVGEASSASLRADLKFARARAVFGETATPAARAKAKALAFEALQLYRGEADSAGEASTVQAWLDAHSIR